MVMTFDISVVTSELDPKMDGVKEVDVDKRLEFWTEGIVEDTRDELTVEEDGVTMVVLVIE